MAKQTTSLQQWTVFIVIVFVTIVTFLFWHLYLRIPQPLDTSDRLVQLEEPQITFINPAQGPTDAPVTIVEFGDYECPSCFEMNQSLMLLKAEYGDQIRHVWKDFPNEELHENATTAAIAGRCAQQQGQFWDFHNELFFYQNQLGEEAYRTTAETVGLDVTRFLQCVRTEQTLPRVQEDFEEGIQLQLTATPTIFINGERFVGSQDIETIQTAIERALK